MSEGRGWLLAAAVELRCRVSRPRLAAGARKPRARTPTRHPRLPAPPLPSPPAVYLFIRVQQPTIPWWKGDEASVCIADEEGECHPTTPPLPPPPVETGCSANVCFLLDGSKSLINGGWVSAGQAGAARVRGQPPPAAVPLTHRALRCSAAHACAASSCLPAVDAWNDVVASARSIMYSIADPAAVFDVFWFSNEVRRRWAWRCTTRLLWPAAPAAPAADARALTTTHLHLTDASQVERIGWTATGAEVAASNKFIKARLDYASCSPRPGCAAAAAGPPCALPLTARRLPPPSTPLPVPRCRRS